MPHLINVRTAPGARRGGAVLATLLAIALPKCPLCIGVYCGAAGSLFAIGSGTYRWCFWLALGLIAIAFLVRGIGSFWRRRHASWVCAVLGAGLWVAAAFDYVYYRQLIDAGLFLFLCSVLLDRRLGRADCAQA